MPLSKADIQALLKHNRPNLSKSSLTSYSSTIFNILKKHDIDDLKTLNKHQDQILDAMKGLSESSRKTKLAGLYILTDNIKFKDQMNKDAKIVNDNYKLQTKNEKEIKNWISFDEIKAIVAKQQELANIALKNFEKTNNELPIVNYLIVGLLSGALGVYPRRSLDYCNFKIKNINPDTDNYFNVKKNEFVFNSYKTKRKYGKQLIKVENPALIAFLKTWIKKSKNDYLLYSSNGNPLLPPQITHRLNHMFGRAASVDAIRHSFLTDLLLNNRTMMPSIQELEHTALRMATSVPMVLQYVKYPDNNKEVESDYSDGAL